MNELLTKTYGTEMPDDMIEMCVQIGLASLEKINPGLGNVASPGLNIPQFSILMAGCVHVYPRFMAVLTRLQMFEMVLNQVLLHKPDFNNFSYTTRVGVGLTCS